MATKEDAIRILSNGYGKKLLHAAGEYVTPIYWGSPPNANMPPKINGATIFFFRCGGMPMAITAAHVYRGYLERKKEEPELLCQVGNLVFKPEERIISVHEELDIVTFQIKEHEVSSIGKVIHEHPGFWPPPPPKPGAAVFYVGFPGEERAVRDWKSLDFGIQGGLIIVDSVSEDKIVCQFHREDWVDVHGAGFPGENAWLGGVSGSPLWRLLETPVVHWYLVGVVTDFSPALEALIITRSDVINLDGTVGRRSS